MNGKIIIGAIIAIIFVGGGIFLLGTGKLTGTDENVH